LETIDSFAVNSNFGEPPCRRSYQCWRFTECAK